MPEKGWDKVFLMLSTSCCILVRNVWDLIRQSSCPGPDVEVLCPHKKGRLWCGIFYCYQHDVIVSHEKCGIRYGILILANSRKVRSLIWYLQCFDPDVVVSHEKCIV